MNKRQPIKYLFSTCLLLGLSIVAVCVEAHEFFSIQDGKLDRPTGYRQWVYVGTPVTPNDMNNGKAAFPEFHNVYIDPKSWAIWTSTGKFQDDTIIIKELVSVGTKSAVSGKGYFQGEFLGLEAAIKSKRYFPKVPGNWGYFSFTNSDHKSLKPIASAFPNEACNSCHAKAAADDFVFTQFYPALRAGKATKEFAIGGVLSNLDGSGH